MREQRSVLVVDDDPAIRNGLKELLTSEGYAVRCAADGQRAVASAVSGHADIVLLDVNLPRLNGFEVARQLREKNFTGAIMMLSARTDQVDKIVGLESGALDYVTKPFDPREVLARIRAHLRMSGQPAASPSARGNLSPGRRILSILFSDMVDFSKTMGQDEKKAMAQLKAQGIRIEKAVKHWSGRVVEVIGDAYVVTFDTALHAVECAMAVQKSLRTYNRKRRGSNRILLRIGIHMGDVTESRGKIRGDAVNVAARLQQISAPGCITMSGSVYESVKGVIKRPIRMSGARGMKNIRQLITVYELHS
jgi:DNA-binding response OmpR family regulator